MSKPPIHRLLSGLNGDWGIGDNGDGTFYIYDDSTGETLWDELSQDEANSYFNMFDTGGGGSQYGGNVDYGSNWWENWGQGVSSFASNLLTTFTQWDLNNKKYNTTNNGNSPDAGSGTTQNPNPANPAIKPGVSTGTIVFAAGIIASIGLIAYTLSRKKAEPIYIETQEKHEPDSTGI